MACLAGLLRMEELEETRTEKLFVPQQSQAYTDQEKLEATFGPDPEYSMVLLRTGPEHPTGNLCDDRTAVRRLFQLEADVENIQITHKGDVYTFGDVCYRWWPDAEAAECQLFSVLSYWNRNITAFEEDEDIRATLSQEFVYDTVNSAIVLQRQVIGGISNSTVDGLLSCTSFLTAINLDRKVDWEIRSKIQSELLELSRLAELESEEYTFLRYATQSFDEEMARSVEQATQYSFVAFMLIVTFLAFSFNNFESRVHSHVLIGVNGIWVITLATMAGIGLGFWMGLMFTPLTILVLYLMLGIGVDNLILLYTSYERVPIHLPIEERNAEAMAHAGAFMAMTSITTALCFAMGSTSLFPVVSDFCVHAVLVVMFNLIFDVTAFDALMVLSTRRAMAGKMDMFPCMEDKKLKEQLAAQLAQAAATSPKIGLQDPTEGSNSKIQKFFDVFAPFIINRKPVKYFLLALFATALALGIYSTTILEEGMEATDILPLDSYVNDFFESFESEFPDLGVFFSVVTGDEVDYTDPQIQTEIENLTVEISQLPSVSAVTVFSVWRFFAIFDQQTNCTSGELPDNFPIDIPINIPPEKQWLFCLNAFITRVSPQFQYDVIIEWTGPLEGYVSTSRIRAQHEYAYSLDSELAQEAVNDVRDLCKQKRKSGLFPNAYPYAFEYTLFDSFAVIFPETVTNFSLSLAMVLAVMFLLVHAGAALIVGVVIVCMDIEIVGWIPLIGLKLDSVSSICIVMAVGIAVDYSIHIVHAFLIAPGTRDEKAVYAIRTMGRPLFSGAFSTFLGVVMLTFVTVPSFSSFFGVMAGIVFVGVTNGIILLPILLSMFGPSCVITPVHSTSAEREARRLSTSGVPVDSAKRPLLGADFNPLIN
eukprot:TRINITY_DN743_c0_g1_i1.p1 TRINITY_DN743_c0_g1~~TRINITY_DN743_c0_g1_i1.p1  ORF type:complete len:950 (+),score=245.10 TRINITY_DN743_c0_g1_i1:223-2850(+)